MSRNWAIVMGIDHYESLRDLKYAQRDAEAMARFCRELDFVQVDVFTADSDPIPIQTFSFDVVTVDSKGKEIKRRRCENEYFREDLGDGIYLDLMKIPAGEFMMGSARGEGFEDEKPQHHVTIAEPFWIGRYQVTQDQWRAVASLSKVDQDLEPDPSGFKGDDHPQLT